MECMKSWRERWVVVIRKIERPQIIIDRHILIEKLSNPKKPLILAFVNAHAMNLIAKSESFFLSLCAADYVFRDGSGMETLFNQLNIMPGLNLNGTDLIPDIIQQFNGRCIALFGTKNPFLERGENFVANNFASRSTFVTANGFLDNNAYISLAADWQPALIVLGMGMPRQEAVALALRSRLDFPCLIICGGAIIDFLGGKVSRAPMWMRRIGLEWLFRLRMEPQRLFKRYVVGNLVFLLRSLIFSTLNRI